MFLSSISCLLLVPQGILDREILNREILSGGIFFVEAFQVNYKNNLQVKLGYS